eukprot:NODE_3776_length_902_cov_34.064516_g3623_i0.p1 GENE.NODE_3776_length_902_cov_34.064516_g3623_i0~~NODE_3776_length_902_cov_34.064516_g3623_i0.p1  ORF type:complete len:264 (+),score=51.14 NODE_3776_length_902_cov_34.064516_g3623_i0:58-849(+)
MATHPEVFENVAVPEADLSSFLRRSRSQSLLAGSQNLIKVDHDEESCCTANIKSLSLTMALFSIITAAQFVGALAANSSALLADCVSMAIDSLSYLANIAGELNHKSKYHGLQKLISSLVSLLVLSAVTIYVSVDPIKLLLGEEAGEEVNPYIVFAFAVWGLTFDLLSFLGFYCFRSHGKQVNILSALLHVGADTLRSTTTFVESILIWIFKFEGDIVDAYACLIVSGLILCGAASGLYAWWKEAREYRKLKPERESLIPALG